MSTNKDTTLIDYISPETEIFHCSHALLFGCRQAQEKTATLTAWLFNNGYFENIIVSGGCTYNIPVSEADELAEKLILSGIPKEKIIIERESSNTKENVIFSRKITTHTDIRKLFLIGRIYAKRRYAMTIKRQWPEIKTISCATVNYFGVDRSRWWSSYALHQRILSESRKIKRYIDNDDIKEIVVNNRNFVL